MKWLIVGSVATLAGMLLGMMFATSLRPVLNPGRALMTLYDRDQQAITEALAASDCDAATINTRIARIASFAPELTALFDRADASFERYALEFQAAVDFAGGNPDCNALRDQLWPQIERSCRACHQAFRIGG